MVCREKGAGRGPSLLCPSAADTVRCGQSEGCRVRGSVPCGDNLAAAAPRWIGSRPWASLPLPARGSRPSLGRSPWAVWMAPLTWSHRSAPSPCAANPSSGSQGAERSAALGKATPDLQAFICRGELKTQ